MPPRRWPTSAAAKAISRSDMPLAFMTSAVTRNIRITISSLPLFRPIADWLVEKGTSGSGRGQNSSPRKLGRNARIPTTDSMKTIGIPASVRATKITASAISGWAPTDSSMATTPHTTAAIPAAPASARNAVRAPWRGSAISRVAPRSTAAR